MEPNGLGGKGMADVQDYADAKTAVIEEILSETALKPLSVRKSKITWVPGP